MVKYRATSLDKTFASNIRKLFLLKISLFLYIPSVILISKCCSAFPELAVIVLNWERSMLTLSFLCSHMCLLWKWISSQFGWTHDNDTKNIHHYLRIPFLFDLYHAILMFRPSALHFFQDILPHKLLPKGIFHHFCWNQKCKLPFSKNGCEIISLF